MLLDCFKRSCDHGLPCLWFYLWGILVALCVLMSGCQEQILPSEKQLRLLRIDRPHSEISVKRLVAQHNAHVAGLDQVWARSDIRLKWRDENGKVRHETGDGVFILARPRRLVLTIGKLGEDVFWAGCDQSRYWLFDLPADTVYHGRHGKPLGGEQRSLLLSISPGQVLHLLGLMPLDKVQWLGLDRGYALIQPVGSNLRLMLNPYTGHVARVDLLGRDGEPDVICLLSKPEAVEQADMPRSQWPYMPTHAIFYVTEPEARLDLTLRGLTDGVRKNRIDPSAFDFDVLMRVHNPRWQKSLDSVPEVGTIP